MGTRTESRTRMATDGSPWRASPVRQRKTFLRCECTNCGVHFHAEAGRVVTGGNCPNCGSYSFDPICVESRQPV